MTIHSFLLMTLLISLLLIPLVSTATPQQTYQQAMAKAASGHNNKAVADLQGAASALPAENIWQERMALAIALIEIRQHQGLELPKFNHASAHARLTEAYLKEKTRPELKSDWLPGLLATIFPGAGHAWQGRWNDALVAAIMVWPMLLLTLWAGYRRMGPVTIFFAMITVWLWSGTVFSSISLAERGDFEAYLVWWQGLWQASALPGRPW